MQCAKGLLAVTLSLALSENRHCALGFVVTAPPSMIGYAVRSPTSAVVFAPPHRHLQDRPPPERGTTLAMTAGEDGIGGDSSSGGMGADGLGSPSEGSGNGGGAVEGESEPASLASLVESSFVMAAAGNSYHEGLKAFIGVVKEAYERGYTVPALTMEVSFVTNRTAGRDLFPEEVELRTVWIALVYLTLQNANWPQKIQRAHEISAPFMDRFADFVENVMTAASKGHNLQTLKLEEVMRRGSEPRTPMEAAVLSQSMRIVFATLDLMKEGWTG